MFDRGTLRRKTSVIGAALALVLTAAACTESGSLAPPSSDSAGASDAAEPIPQPVVTGVPIAPESDRVDLTMPTFSDPTNVTNPLHPTSESRSVLLLGTVDDKPFRAEVTLLPDTRVMEWNGRRIEAVVSQYAAFSGGRIHEVALDLYAQADDGSVWYFGEDVFNYENGVVADTSGTWFAGKDGPAAMIMPGDPQVGDVYRPENIPDVVFEEVTVRSVGERVDGPSGPVEGALLVQELHMDGALEDKTFAPGYGEFFTGGGGDVEALAVAVPVDAVPGQMPGALASLADEAMAIFYAAGAGDWDAAGAARTAMATAWDEYRANGVPPMLEAAMEDALAVLDGPIAGRDEAGTRRAAIAAGLAATDLQLRHRPQAAIDVARLGLWARQLVVDVESGGPGAVAGDLAVFDWIRPRFAGSLGSLEVSRIDLRLGELRAAAIEGDAAGAAEAASALVELIAGLELA